MRARQAVVLALVVVFVTAGLALAQKQEGKAQTICPVLGAAIDKKVYTDHQGQRIYFCCDHCIGEFKKDPDKYLKKMKEQGVTPEKTPAGK